MDVMQFPRMVVSSRDGWDLVARERPPMDWLFPELYTGPVMTTTSPAARCAYLRVSCSILDQAPPLCFWACGTMLANEKLCAIAAGVGMSPAGAMCPRE